MARSLVPLLIVCNVLAQTLSCAQCRKAPLTDRERLLALKEAIANWSEFADANGVEGWDLDTPVCAWTGVTCSRGTIVEVNLSCTNATEGLCSVPANGTLAPQLASIKTLEILDLQGQALAGPLPAFWGRKGAFPQLMILNLAGNNLTGRIPQSWGGSEAFPLLDSLDLSGNPLLCGVLPQALEPKLACAEDAEDCTVGALTPCPAPKQMLDGDSDGDSEDDGGDNGEDSKERQGPKVTPQKKEQCIQGELPKVPSWAKKYNSWIAAKEDAQDQAKKNKGIVEEANEEGVRYDFVMYGDSITWRADMNPDVWEEHFGSLLGPSAPLGVIFNQVSDLAYRITTGDELFKLPPKVVVLLIGVNNIERGPQPAEHLDGLIRWLKGAYPGTHLIVLNLLPAAVDVYLDIDGTNEQYKRVAEENDVAFSTCGSDIDPTDRSQMYDGIHPAAGGLEVLFSCLGPEVAQAVADSPC